MTPSDKEEENFQNFLQQTAVQPLLAVHYKILNDKRSKFVGTKTLFHSLKLVQICIKHKHTRQYIQEHMRSILFDLSLPLMLITQHEFNQWNENPVEYIRMQVDQSDSYNIKLMVKYLVGSICSIKVNRKQKISQYLQEFLELIANNLEQPQQDFRVKEALLHTLGNLKEQIEDSLYLQGLMTDMLEKYAFQELKSENSFLRARACWLYGQFGSFPCEK